VSVNLQHEECLGSAQVSLADFDLDTPVSLKWYNVLSLRLMVNEQKVAVSIGTFFIWMDYLCT
jgi:hypothetical protein